MVEDDCKKRIESIISGFKGCSSAFTAIGDETRQLILLTLLESDLGGIRVGEIATKTHLSRPSVSHHLKILKDANIVSMRKVGTKNYYYLSNDETMWGEIVNLINLIYVSIQHIDKIAK